jgi:hypothetical protein
MSDRSSKKSRLILLGTLLVAFNVEASKMAMADIPWVPVPMFAIPSATKYDVALSLAGTVAMPSTLTGVPAADRSRTRGVL